MKITLASVTMAFAVAISIQAADVSVKLSDVHLCCKGCVKGVQSAADTVKGLTVSADQDAGTVSLSGPDKASVQKGVDALVAAGYFGKSSDAAVKVSADTGAKGKQVQ